MSGRIIAIIILLCLLFGLNSIADMPIFFHSEKENYEKVKEKGNEISFTEEYIITSRDDFENGSYDYRIDTVTYPGSLTLRNYTCVYYVGKNTSVSMILYEGYTILPSDDSFKFTSDGIVKKVSIRTGMYAGRIKIKILRYSAAGWFCTAESNIINLTSFTLKTYEVNLAVNAEDRLGIYILEGDGYYGEISIASRDSLYGYWKYKGDVSSQPVTMDWVYSPLTLTIEAAVISSRYYSEGNWTSNTIELRTYPEHIKISWKCYLPIGAGLIAYARSSIDGNAWSSWEIVTNNSIYPSLGRFIQIMLCLKSDGAHVPIFHELIINYSYVIALLINEFSSFGDSEWIEIVNLGMELNLLDIEINDRDSLSYRLPYIILKPNEHYVIRLSGDNLDDNGDDIALSYRGRTLDYISYASRFTSSLDGPPSDYNFILDGAGFEGRIPSPGPNESAFLSPDGARNCRASAWFIASGYYLTPGSKNPTIIFAWIEDFSPAEIYPGETIHLMNIKLRSNNDRSNVTVSGIRIIVSGNINYSEIEKVSIYLDSDNDSQYSTTDVLIDETAFYSYSLSIITNLSIDAVRNRTLLIYVKFSPNATPSHKCVFSVVEIRCADSMPLFKNSPSTKEISIRHIDNDSPFITAIEFSSLQPFGKGTHYFKVNFNEKMNINIMPNIIYYRKYSTSYNYTANSRWINEYSLEGEIKILDHFMSGHYILSISNARDVANNKMMDFQYEFVVDTDMPSVREISVPSRLGLGTHAIIINFTEDMDTAEKIKATLQFENYTKEIYGKWLSRRSWEGKITIFERGVNTVGTIKVFGGRDLANNPLRDFIYYVVIDTLPPITVSESWSEDSPVGDNRTIHIRVEFNEDIKALSAYLKNDSELFPIHVFEIQKNEFLLFLNTSEISEGLYEIVLVNVTDLSGNFCNISLKKSLVVDKTPPKLKIMAPSEIPEGKLIEIYVYVEDFSGISNITLFYSTGKNIFTIAMTKVSENTYKADIPGYLAGSILRYTIQAVDFADNSCIYEGVIYRTPSWLQYPMLWLIVFIVYTLPFLFEFLIKRKK